MTKKLLSGNEAMALGAYHAGVQVASAYPGTPSTEILQAMAQFKDIYAEWSTNEKVAMEVGLGASYTGVRCLVSMKHVGLNVASDPFMAASITGIVGGMVVISADDPGIHSSQNEQDNRHYAKLAKVPILEPSDSQEAYDLMSYAFDISEQFDTPVLFRSTTRISHSKTVVDINKEREAISRKPQFMHNIQKYVMLPVFARVRHAEVEERLVKLTAYAETFPFNQVIWNKNDLGIITCGIAYQYAREVFPDASFLKLGMSYPLPRNLINDFSKKVDKLIVIEELDPFLQENIQAMGIKVMGKEFIPLVGELSTSIIENAAKKVGLLDKASNSQYDSKTSSMPGRPPLLCPGCPHSGIYFVLNTVGKRSKLPQSSKESAGDNKLIITGDIGCYTLGAYPPINSLDTTACMGAGIGQACGMEKAGISRKVVSVIGDSTFLHSGITSVVNAVYNKSHITIVVLDNGTTAMTGHQDHPGTGVSAQGEETQAVDIEQLVKGIGVTDVKVVDAFNIKEIRSAIRDSLDNNDLSIVIVRGFCSVRLKARPGPRIIDLDKCDDCGTCLLIGCRAIQKHNNQMIIDASLCAGDACTICQQICPRKAIVKSSSG